MHTSWICSTYGTNTAEICLWRIRYYLLICWFNLELNSWNFISIKENVSKPYSATVFINDVEYGKGFGSSKKEAKTEAARASLNILIPDLNNDSDSNDEGFDNIVDLQVSYNLIIEFNFYLILIILLL